MADYAEAFKLPFDKSNTELQFEEINKRLAQIDKKLLEFDDRLEKLKSNSPQKKLGWCPNFVSSIWSSLFGSCINCVAIRTNENLSNDVDHASLEHVSGEILEEQLSKLENLNVKLEKIRKTREQQNDEFVNYEEAKKSFENFNNERNDQINKKYQEMMLKKTEFKQTEALKEESQVDQPVDNNEPVIKIKTD